MFGIIRIFPHLSSTCAKLSPLVYLIYSFELLVALAVVLSSVSELMDSVSLAIIFKLQQSEEAYN